MMSDFQHVIDQMLRLELMKEFWQRVDEELTPSPGWQGFTGIRGIVDEWGPLVEWPPLSWTPKEFQRMWDSLTYESKIAFVKNRIT
jgi:hypothetical protein